MTPFEAYWEHVVLRGNPALADNPFLRPLAEAAWNAGAAAERAACARFQEDRSTARHGYDKHGDGEALRTRPTAA